MYVPLRYSNYYNHYLDNNSSGARAALGDANVMNNSGGTITNDENTTAIHFYETTFGGGYTEYQSDDSSPSTKLPMGKKNVAY